MNFLKIFSFNTKSDIFVNKYKFKYMLYLYIDIHFQNRDDKFRVYSYKSIVLEALCFQYDIF